MTNISGIAVTGLQKVFFFAPSKKSNIDKSLLL